VSATPSGAPDRPGIAGHGLPRLGADAAVGDVLAALDQQGCAVIEALLPAREVADLQAALERLLTATPSGRNAFEGFRTQRVYNLFGKTRAFDGLALHPLVTGVLDDVLVHYQLSAPVGLQIGPGEVAQVLHYDDAVYPLAWPHAPVVLNTMWALCDYTEANGATRLIPGSHRWDRQRVPATDETLAAEMEAGSVLIYPGTLWHSGGANTTDRPRPGLLMEYVAGWLRPQETHLLGVPPEVVRTLPAELQELLGYNVFPPFLGYVDGRHPRRTLGETQGAEG
jgi:ectoine hydroxylase-related dioxygenase (phytanoyl-CoA dioxygenase family)